MKKFKTIIAVTLVLSMALSIVACKGGDDVEESTSDSETTTTVPVETTTVPTTTLPTYQGPESSYEGEVSWGENAIEQTVMYAVVSEGEFLNVRIGPGVDYDKAGTLTRNQQVVVVALCNNGWYKTSDGFYVSGDYLSDTQV